MTGVDRERRESLKDNETVSEKVPAVYVNNLDVFRDSRFGARPVLKKISFTSNGPGVTAFIGPSGCGKSTLVGCINGLHREYSEGIKVEGEVCATFKDPDGNLHNFQVFGKKPDKNLSMLSSCVGFVQQQTRLYSWSILDNVTYGLHLRGERNKRVLKEAAIKYLTMTGVYDEIQDRLYEKATGATDQFSGGQIQRIALARTLCIEPSILILDEPTANLDPGHKLLIAHLILKLAETKTILLITHERNLFELVANKVIFITAKRSEENGTETIWGEAVEEGDVYSILNNPQHPDLQKYLGGETG